MSAQETVVAVAAGTGAAVVAKTINKGLIGEILQRILREQLRGRHRGVPELLQDPFDRLVGLLARLIRGYTQR